jgi:hypothetical protein
MWTLILDGEIGEPLIAPDKIRTGDFRPLQKVHPFLTGTTAKKPDRISTTALTLFDKRKRMLGFLVIAESGHLKTLHWPRNLRSPHLKQVRP